MITRRSSRDGKAALHVSVLTVRPATSPTRVVWMRCMCRPGSLRRLSPPPYSRGLPRQCWTGSYRVQFLWSITSTAPA